MIVGGTTFPEPERCEAAGRNHVLRHRRHRRTSQRAAISEQFRLAPRNAAPRAPATWSS